MKFTDETLMAFADGELDEPARSEVERALQADPEVAARVKRHQALRGDVFGAFSGVLDEPVPARLRMVASAAAAQEKVVEKVVPISRARAARQPAPERPRSPWAQWGGMAASLAIGVLAGVLGIKGMQDGPHLVSSGGALVAEGQLDRALSQQPASTGATVGPVRIGTSFVDKSGDLCRSFTLGANAGLACRANGQWQVPVLAAVEAAPVGAYRQAGAALPPAVLEAIDARIAGQALDASAERAALERGWTRAAPAP